MRCCRWILRWNTACDTGEVMQASDSIRNTNPSFTRAQGRRAVLAATTAFFVVLITLSLFPATCLAENEPAKAPAAVAPTARPPVEWTKIQDLRPDARATDRPVKDKWAVVVGLGTFAERALNNGIGMDQAAREFYNFLVDPKAGRFDKDHIVLMTNAEATRQSILASTGSQWLGQVAGPDDLVVIFIGTHGFPAGDGNTYLCTYNSALDNLFVTGISMKSFMESLRKNIKSDRIVLVLQACYSGAAELTSGAKALYKNYNIDLEQVVLGKGYVIASSSKPDQMTWGDVFSRNLVKSLREKDGLVPFQEAFAAASQRTEYDTTHECQGCNIQSPVLKSEWVGKDLVVGVPPVSRVKALPDGAVNFLAAETHYMLASKQAAAGDLEGAIKEYQATIGTDPSYANAYGDYGSVLAMTGNWSEAAEKFRQAIALAPSDELFHANYARVLARLGKDQESTAELKLAYGLNPKDRHVLTALSDRSLKAGDPAQAVQYLKEALALYPKSAALHDRMSYVLTRKGDLPTAQSHAQDAVTFDPSSATARMNLGSILLLRGNLTDALFAYRAAVKLAPENPDTHYLLSSALEAKGDNAAAIDELRKFLEICRTDDPKGLRARKHLAELIGER